MPPKSSSGPEFAPQDRPLTTEISRSLPDGSVRSRDAVVARTYGRPGAVT